MKPKKKQTKNKDVISNTHRSGEPMRRRDMSTHNVFVEIRKTLVHRTSRLADSKTNDRKF
jgi:hypothetical protein